MHGPNFQNLKRGQGNVSDFNICSLYLVESVFMYQGGHAWQGQRVPFIAGKPDDFMIMLQQAFGSRRERTPIDADDSINTELGSSTTF